MEPAPEAEHLGHRLGKLAAGRSPVVVELAERSPVVALVEHSPVELVDHILVLVGHRVVVGHRVATADHRVEVGHMVVAVHRLVAAGHIRELGTTATHKHCWERLALVGM